MASLYTDGTLGAPSEKRRATPTLWTMLRTTRTQLKSIDEERKAAQNEIMMLWGAISDAQSDYWAQEANDFDEFVKKGGENNFDHWRSKFSRKEARRAKEVARQQSNLRSQVCRLEQSLTQLDDEYWKKWNACLEALSGSGANIKKTPSREAKSANPSGPSGIRKTRSKDTSSSPRRPPSTSKAGLKKAIERFATSPSSDTKVVSPIEHKEKHVTRPTSQDVASSISSPCKTVLNPIPGQVYQAFYDEQISSEKGWYMGTPLPWNGEEWKNEIRLDFTMGQMDLISDFPECYIPETTRIEKQDEHGNTTLIETITGIKGWAQGFEDGGPREKDRHVLFLFFDDRSKRPGNLNIPKRPTSTIKFSKWDLASLPIDWVATKDLRPAGVNDEALLRGRATAGKFKRFMDKVQRAGVPRGLHGDATEELEGDTQGDITGFSVDTPGNSTTPQKPTQEPACKDEVMSDSENNTVGISCGPYGGQEHQRNMHLLDLAPGRMDANAEYDETMAAGRNQSTSAPMIDPEEFDEGVGMDFDLDFGQSKFQLSVVQSSPARDGQEDTTGEIPVTEPSDQPRQAPTSPPLVGSTLEARHVTSTDYGWASQDEPAASDDFQEHRD